MLMERNPEIELHIHRTPLFDRCLEGLRKKRGAALAAAEKTDEFLRHLTEGGRSPREKFSFTWNGEHRIRNCVKVDLPCGYRIVCIKKNGHLFLLYVGSHDDCFRWIERNKGLSLDPGSNAGRRIFAETPGVPSIDDLPVDVIEEKRFSAEFEDALMKKIDDEVLAGIFSGWYRGGKNSAL
jgi:hypothetical protein